MPPRIARMSTAQEQKSLVGLYDLGDTIGTGGFGKVKLATHILTGETVAIKIMDKAALGDEYDRALREISIMKALRHPRICELYQVIDTADKLYIVLEHCVNGELFDFIMTKDRLTEEEARKFFRQVVSAVAFMHYKGCAHRDLKPENLLLDEKQNIKLIDFGLAARPKAGMDSLLETCCGSPAYVAPELIEGKRYLGAQADIWSLGVLLYALLVGSLPFYDDDVNKLFDKIKGGVFDLPSFLSRESKDFLRAMLQLDPQKRVTMADIVCHRWMMGTYCVPVKWKFKADADLNLELLQKMAAVSPNRATDMRQSVILRKYDYWMATYLILKNRTRLGKVVRLYVAGLPLNNVENLETRVSGRLISSPSPIKRPASPCKGEMYQDRDRRFSQISYDDSASDTSISENGSINPSFESLAESGSFRDPNNYKCVSPIKRYDTPPSCKKEPSPRLTPSRSLEDNLDRPGRMSKDCEKCRSASNGIDNVSFTSPKKIPRSAKVADKGRSSDNYVGKLRKVFGSIDAGLDRVRGMLTPALSQRATTKSGRTLRVLKADRVTNNVTAVKCSDADSVMVGLKKALSACGLDWKVKRGYILRAKKVSPAGELVLKLSLEICWLSDQNTCGIRRKRLQGDGFRYKMIFASLQKVLNFRESSTNPPSVVSLHPKKLVFDV